MAILKILIGQTKVGNFANKVVIKKNITSCQVSMDYLQNDINLHCEYDNTFQKVSLSCHSGKKNINLTESQQPFPDFWNQGPSLLTIANKYGPGCSKPDYR